jgi:hypothetical protein
VSWNCLSIRRLAAAAAVMTVAIMLAGCGTDTGHTGAAAESGSAGPQAGSRAQAEAFARQLTARLVFPPGTQPARLSPVPASLRDPWADPAGSALAGAVNLGRLDAVALKPAAAEAFLLTHTPRGALSPGTGQQNGSRGITERYLYFQLGSLPRGINDAEVMMLMVPRGAASTLVATYVHVIWFPHRTAAEYLAAADFSAVSVKAVKLNPKPHDTTRTFRSPADIARLAGVLNGFAAAPATAHTCPASDASYQITFQPRAAERPAVVATTFGCYGATVTVGGVPQPALLDPRNTLPATAASLLGRKGLWVGELAA